MNYMSQSDLEAELEFQLKAVGLKDFVKEFQFHPKRRWRADFCFSKQRVLIEVDGGTWNGGRHTTGAGYTTDCVKLSEAVLLGWTVLRFSSDMVKNGTALDYIERVLKMKDNKVEKKT